MNFLLEILKFIDESYSTWTSFPAWDWVWMRLVVASLLGGIIGAERQLHGRSVGLRTQLLVALGCSLIMTLSREFANAYTGIPSMTIIRIDPARMAYGVTTGIGFIGAGAIIRDRGGVRGITTAASLWCTGAVGLVCGFGMFELAVVATIIALFALFVLDKFHFFIQPKAVRTLQVSIRAAEGQTSGDTTAGVTELLGAMKVRSRNIRIYHDLEHGRMELTFQVRTPQACQLSELAGAVSERYQVLKITVS